MSGHGRPPAVSLSGQRIRSVRTIRETHWSEWFQPCDAPDGHPIRADVRTAAPIAETGPVTTTGSTSSRVLKRFAKVGGERFTSARTGIDDLPRHDRFGRITSRCGVLAPQKDAQTTKNGSLCCEANSPDGTMGNPTIFSRLGRQARLKKLLSGEARAASFAGRLGGTRVLPGECDGPRANDPRPRTPSPRAPFRPCRRHGSSGPSSADPARAGSSSIPSGDSELGITTVIKRSERRGRSLSSEAGCPWSEIRKTGPKEIGPAVSPRAGALSHPDGTPRIPAALSRRLGRRYRISFGAESPGTPVSSRPQPDPAGRDS